MTAGTNSEDAGTEHLAVMTTVSLTINFDL